MPHIVVRTSGIESKHGADVLRERIAASDLESEQFTSRLLERISWALDDADSIETQVLARDGLIADPPRRPPAG